GIDAARFILQLVDDLHRPHLWRASHRAAGKCRAQTVNGSLIAAQMPCDSAHQLMNGRVAFYMHEFWHGDGAKAANSSKIVAQEIDDHQVFRMALRIIREPLAELLIFRRVRATPDCPLDRFCLHDAGGTDLEKPFHRRASNLYLR